MQHGAAPARLVVVVVHRLAGGDGLGAEGTSTLLLDQLIGPSLAVLSSRLQSIVGQVLPPPLRVAGLPRRSGRSPLPVLSGQGAQWAPRSTSRTARPPCPAASTTARLAQPLGQPTHPRSTLGKAPLPPGTRQHRTRCRLGLSRQSSHR